MKPIRPRSPLPRTLVIRHQPHIRVLLFRVPCEIGSDFADPGGYLEVLGGSEESGGVGPEDEEAVEVEVYF